MHGVVEGDAGLLDLARVVLEEAYYRVTAALDSEPPVLLAEDENNVVAVTAVLSPGQIVGVEPSVSRVLTERLVEARVPEKRWDGYVVLLCAQRADTEQSRVLAELANNLRQLRRVIRVGVQPTHAAVARALRPLLPLTKPVRGATLGDPLDALIERLIRDGLPAAAVAEVVAAYRIDVGVPLIDEEFDEAPYPPDEESDLDD
jgi:hypothetical protein